MSTLRKKSSGAVRATLLVILLLILVLIVTIPASGQEAEPFTEEAVNGDLREQLEPVAAEDIRIRDTSKESLEKMPAEAWATAQADGSGERSVYIIRLRAPSVAQYEGGILDLEATSTRATGEMRLDLNTPESVAYTEFLDRSRENFISSMNKAVGREVTVNFEYYATLNGLAAELTAKEMLVVAEQPNVSFIEPDQEFELETFAGPEWMNADAIWTGLGTLLPTYGEGVIVGVIDTGINPDHPSFADIGGDGFDHINPLGSGNYVGVCDPGDPSYLPSFPCNDKLIGAWGFVSADPTDLDGHGSHTASTAAGNFVPGAVVNTPNGYVVTEDISGVAPHANIIAYGACCTGSALSAAREQVVIDGVDVVNYSIGSASPTSDPWGSSFAVQWLAVYDAGIFVATSAGNNGNGFATIGSPGDLPWMTTIGASTHDVAYLNSLINMSGGDTAAPADIHGRSVTVGYGPAPIVYAGDFGDALCLNPFPAGTFSGEIVVCDRGVIARVQKGANIAAGGAGGLVLAEVTPGGIGALAADTHIVPTVHVTDTDGDALKAWLASGAGHAGTITGTTLDQQNANGNIMAKFSSRGQNLALPDIVKPDVTAPGVGIMAAYHDGVEYDIIQGTSMSSPHVAGAGALLRALHPSWTAGEIQSALMTTANANVADNDGATQADFFAMGAGHVDLAQAGAAGLVLNVTSTEFEDANPSSGGDPSALNLSSMGQDQCVGTCSWTRTVRNPLAIATEWNVSTAADAGMSISVLPTNFTLDPGATQEIEVTADVGGAPEGEWLFGTVYLTEATALAPEAHLPVAAAFSPGSLPVSVDIVTRRNAGSQLATGLRAVEITDLTTTVYGLVKGDVTEEYLVSDPTNGDPYDGSFDPQVDGTFFINVDVPVGAVNFIAEIPFSESSDLDLFVGSGVVPSAATELCSSTSGSSAEYCELPNPAADTYWVLVQNWDSGNGAALPGELAVLNTAVIPGSDSGNMTVEGPSSVPANTPFDVRVFWDIPTMAVGDRWYGAFELGSDPGNPGNIGMVPVTVDRLPDDVTKSVSQDTAVAGDVLTYEIVVQPNITPVDLAYTVTDTIPEGMSYVPGSAAATDGVVDVVDDTLTWTGTMIVPELEYVMSTSDSDPLCDTGFGGYLNLEAHGILANSGIVGDTVGFTAFSTGNLFNYYGQEYAGMSFTDDGFGIFDFGANYGGNPWVPQVLPNSDLPNNVLAALWHDFELFYDGPANQGVSLATAGDNLIIIEYDDVEPWGGGAPMADFEIVMTRAVSNAPGAYEIVYAYDNIASPFNATVGVENADGTAAAALLNNEDIGPVLSDGFMVCFDQVGAADPVLISYDVTVDTTEPGVLTNNVVHDTDNPGSLPASTSVDVSVINGGLAYCAYAEGGDVIVGDGTYINCSLGSRMKTKLKSDVIVEGDITSYRSHVMVGNRNSVSGEINAKSRVMVGKSSSVQEDIFSNSSIVLNKDSFVGGDATARRRVVLKSGAVVAGTITERAVVTTPVQPPKVKFSLNISGPNVTVNKGESLHLAPGQYGRLLVGQNAILTLSPGEYAFKEIAVKQYAEIVFDLSGPCPHHYLIEVDRTIKMEKGVDMYGLGGGSPCDREVMFVVDGGLVQLIGGSYTGTFIAPKATIRLNNSLLYGTLYGRKVDLGKGSWIELSRANDLYADYFVNP